MVRSGEGLPSVATQRTGYGDPRTSEHRGPVSDVIPLGFDCSFGSAATDLN